MRDCTCLINGKDDPDCELHHPEVREDPFARRQGLGFIRTIALPYDLTQDTIRLEPYNESQTLQDGLDWLAREHGDAEEVERILRGTMVLWNVACEDGTPTGALGEETFARCLHTAIVWERG